MKKTSKEFMEWLGLKVGDRVKFIVDDITYIGVVGFYGNILSFIVENKNENETSPIFDLSFIIHEEIDFKILPQPKRVGDLKCGEYGEQNCDSCPVRAICVSGVYNDDTLYKKLELSHKYAKDQEIYDILKARLDKEVEEQ